MGRKKAYQERKERTGRLKPEEDYTSFEKYKYNRIQRNMNKPMTGSEIARELNITRQAVSQTLKSGVRKMYNEILKQDFADTPFDALVAMMYGFNLHEASHEEIVDFFFLLPNDIRREIKKDARCKF